MALITYSASWPGLTKIRKVTGTMTRGIRPDVWTIQTTPEGIAGGFATFGNLVLFRNGTPLLTLPDCWVTRADVDRSGTFINIRVVDRRWRWAFGAAAGVGNLRQPDGSLDGFTETTPQAIAAQLLVLLGEVGFDVSALPDIARPEIMYDFNKPANALQKLCDELNTHISFNVATGGVRLWGNNFGNPLPSGGESKDVVSVEGRPAPPAVVALSNVTEFQRRWPLELVGLELDDNVKPLQNVSYRPSTGFNPYSCAENVAGNEAKRRAQRTAYRWARIKNDPIQISVGGIPITINSPQRQLFFKNQGIKLDVGSGPGLGFPSDAKLYGTFFDGGVNPNDATYKQYTGDFEFDTEKQLVKVPVPLSDPNRPNFEPSQLELECIAWARNNALEPIRWGFTVNTGTGVAAPNEYLIHNDVNSTSLLTYDENGNAQGWLDNTFTANATLGPYAQQRVNSYIAVPARTVVYDDLVLVAPDGLIEQVSINMTVGSLVTTSVSIASTLNRFKPTSVTQTRQLNVERSAIDADNKTTDRRSRDRGR